jgi:exopolysaccharide biosynthesis predicted pyruvyltransferase EpsI
MHPGYDEAAVRAAAEAIHAKTERGFAWLAEAVDPLERVSFVPNPGNIGDAAINLSCWRFLSGRFAEVEMCPLGRMPAHRHVFVGGGGNLVEPLYRRVADFIDSVPGEKRLHLFPSTIDGFGELIASRGSSIRIVCREATSYRHVLKLIPAGNAFLGHDAALALGPWLRSALPKVERLTEASAKPFRRDRERAIAEDGGLDIMGQYQSDWTDPALAEKSVRLAAGYLLGFGRVETDRLHCAILSALLGRQTTLRPNSYFKNAAVFAHSLSRFPNVEFNEA